MSLEELEFFISQNEIEEIETLIGELKNTDKSGFVDLVDKLKVLFINSYDILFLNKVALTFKEYRIHSGVPLIISKLLLPSFQENGGTLIYSLVGLRKKTFFKELQSLWSHNISYEMEQMLMLNNILDLENI